MTSYVKYTQQPVVLMHNFCFKSSHIAKYGFRFRSRYRTIYRLPSQDLKGHRNIFKMASEQNQDSLCSDSGYNQPKSSVLVYKGEGGGEDSTEHFYKALLQVVDPRFHTVEYITPEQIKQGLWTKTCRVIAFGGGYDLGFVRALGRSGTKKIRDFVHQGGTYLGMCAGAYWACDYIEFDKGGPLQVLGERFLKFYPGHCIGPAFPGFQYKSKKGVHAVPILYKGLISCKSYLHGGGYFTLPKGTPGTCGPSLNVSGQKPQTSSPDLSASTVTFDTGRSVSLIESYDNVSLSNISGAHGLPTQIQESSSTSHVQSHFSSSGIVQATDIPYVTDAPCWSEESGRSSHTHYPQVSFQTLATFSSLEHRPGAVVKCSVGRGTAILSCVHLEFPVALLDHGNPNLKAVLPQLQESEAVRDYAFRDILEQLCVRLKSAKSSL